MANCKSSYTYRDNGDGDEMLQINCSCGWRSDMSVNPDVARKEEIEHRKSV